MKTHLTGSLLLLVSVLAALLSGCQPDAPAGGTSASAKPGAAPADKPADKPKAAAPLDDCGRVKACCDKTSGGTKEGCDDSLEKGQCKEYIELIAVVKGVKPADYAALPDTCQALAP
jgi:hypothetical protein